MRRKIPSLFRRSHRPHAVAVLFAVALTLLAGCGAQDAVDADEVDAAMAEASRYMQSLDFAKAEDVWKTVYARVQPEDERWLEVAFGYATSAWHRTPPGPDSVKLAQEVFGRIVRQSPGSDYALASELSLARILMLRDFPGDVQDPHGAMLLLKPIMEQDRNPVFRHEAALRHAEALQMQVERPDAAERTSAFLEDWLQRHPDNPYASVMWERLAGIYLYDLKRKAEGLDALLQAERIGLVNTAFIGRTYWKIAELARELGRFDVAVRFYTRAIVEAPRTGRSWEAQQRLADIRDTVPGFENLDIPEPMISARRDDNN